jgi:hypothetical protein
MAAAAMQCICICRAQEGIVGACVRFHLRFMQVVTGQGVLSGRLD